MSSETTAKFTEFVKSFDDEQTKAFCVTKSKLGTQFFDTKNIEVGDLIPLLFVLFNQLNPTDQLVLINRLQKLHTLPQTPKPMHETSHPIQ